MALAYNYDQYFQVLLIGDSGVGKTCVLFRFSDDSFNNSFISTSGIDSKIKRVQVDGKTIKLQIWDADRPERFYRGVEGILLVYDITNEKSFENIKNWIRNIEEHASQDVEAIRMIIGNKSDMEGNRKVMRRAGLQLAREYGMKFMETSAKANRNVEDAFLTLAKDIKVKMERGQAIVLHAPPPPPPPPVLPPPAARPARLVQRVGPQPRQAMQGEGGYWDLPPGVDPAILDD